MRLSWGEGLRGRTVIDGSGLALGEVEELFFDDTTWRVESLRVKLKRDVAQLLGVPHGLLHAGTIEVPTSYVRGVSDAVVLTTPCDGLRPLVPPERGARPAPT